MDGMPIIFGIVLATRILPTFGSLGRLIMMIKSKHLRTTIVLSLIITSLLSQTNLVLSATPGKNKHSIKDDHAVLVSQTSELSQLIALAKAGIKFNLPEPISGFKYDHDSKELGIFVNSEYGIKPLIPKEQKIKYTNYNRVTVKNISYRGIDLGRKEVQINGRIRYQKLENKPWPLSGRYTIFDDAADLKMGLNLYVENQQLKTRTNIREFKPGWASGPVGYIYSVFDAGMGTIAWFSTGGNFIRISDFLGSLSQISVNIAQPFNRELNSKFKYVNDKVAEFSSQGLFNLDHLDYDSDGFWLVFKVDQNHPERVVGVLTNIINMFFPNATLSPHLNLMFVNSSRGSSSGHNDNNNIVTPPLSPCPQTFSPATFQGRTGKVAFYNEWDISVTVILYHPNNGSIYNRYTVPPKQNYFLGNNIIVGDDWGVCFENKPNQSGFVNNLGTISDYNPHPPQGPLFMIQNPRIN
jgi:hypothetical protein